MEIDEEKLHDYIRNHLTGIERVILCYYYGIDREQIASFREIGYKVRLNESRTFRLYHEAKLKVKKAFCPFCGEIKPEPSQHFCSKNCEEKDYLKRRMRDILS